MSGRNYQDLVAWQKAMDLVELVYRASERWPKEERYGLTNQVRREAVSIPYNLAEGQGRTGSNEFLHYLSITHGSLREVETQLLIGHRLGYLGEAALAPLMDQAGEVGRLVQGLMRSLR